MNKFISIFGAATAVLAFYNEAVRAGLLEPIDFKPIRLFGTQNKE